mmetsp:Transcript_19309/g.62074  ORF Transcript_19309/g.62074 Transcript_19309/m.62074 type:complete len:323 (-) Transcript_19309:416-1384(-)
MNGLLQAACDRFRATASDATKLFFVCLDGGTSEQARWLYGLRNSIAREFLQRDMDTGTSKDCSATPIYYQHVLDVVDAYAREGSPEAANRKCGIVVLPLTAGRSAEQKWLHLNTCASGHPRSRGTRRATRSRRRGVDGRGVAVCLRAHRVEARRLVVAEPGSDAVVDYPRRRRGGGGHDGSCSCSSSSRRRRQLDLRVRGQLDLRVRGDPSTSSSSPGCSRRRSRRPRLDHRDLCLDLDIPPRRRLHATASWTCRSDHIQPEGQVGGRAAPRLHASEREPPEGHQVLVRHSVQKGRRVLRRDGNGRREGAAAPTPRERREAS